jgi:regulatory protein
MGMSLCTELGLSVGDIIDCHLAPTFLPHLMQEQCRNYLIRCLERREHTKLELKQKAMQKGYDADLCENQIGQLEELGWQSDLRFSEQFCTTKKNAGWGAHKIRAHLHKKGIHKKIITQIEHHLESSEDEVMERMTKLVQKKAAGWAKYPAQKRKERIYRHLIQKGFDGNAILKNLSELMDLITAPH